jgi:hypothetical protein
VWKSTVTNSHRPHTHCSARGIRRLTKFADLLEVLTASAQGRKSSAVARVGCNREVASHFVTNTFTVTDLSVGTHYPMATHSAGQKCSCFADHHIRALNDVRFGVSPFTIKATASSGLTVNFTSIVAAVCTIAGTTVTIVRAGISPISAAQRGNTAFTAATPVTQSFTANAVNGTALDPLPPKDVWRYGR